MQKHAAVIGDNIMCFTYVMILYRYARMQLVLKARANTLEHYYIMDLMKEKTKHNIYKVQSFIIISAVRTIAEI